SAEDATSLVLMHLPRAWREQRAEDGPFRMNRKGARDCSCMGLRGLGYEPPTWGSPNSGEGAGTQGGMLAPDVPRPLPLMGTYSRVFFHHSRPKGVGVAQPRRSSRSRERST